LADIDSNYRMRHSSSRPQKPDLISRKPGKFYRTMCRIDKTMLLLITATWCLTLSKTLSYH